MTLLTHSSCIFGTKRRDWCVGGGIVKDGNDQVKRCLVYSFSRLGEGPPRGTLPLIPTLSQPNLLHQHPPQRSLPSSSKPPVSVATALTAGTIQSELTPNTIQSSCPQTVLQRHFLSPHEFRHSSRTEVFIITVAPGTQLIFIKHFLAPGIALSTFSTITCLIFTTIRGRCFYYTLLTYEETEMERT